MHSNLPLKTKLNIFDFKYSKLNLNRTKIEPKIWQWFGWFFFCSLVLCTPLQEKILTDTSNHKLKPIENLNAALLGFNLNIVFVTLIDVEMDLLEWEECKKLL